MRKKISSLKNSASFCKNLHIEKLLTEFIVNLIVNEADKPSASRDLQSRRKVYIKFKPQSFCFLRKHMGGFAKPIHRRDLLQIELQFKLI